MTSNRAPLVSVVMPLYNSSDFMNESISSVLRQTFTDFELLLVDDASSDTTSSVATQLARSDGRVLLTILEKNVGPATSRNTAIARARGRYIAFIDSDDVWSERKLEAQLAAMQELRASLSYTDYNIRFESDYRNGRSRYTPKKVSYRELLKHNVIGCSTVIYDAEALGKRYFPEFRKRQDFALWLSILKEIHYAHRCGHALTTYRIRNGSVSANKLVAAFYTWRIYYSSEKLGLARSFYYFGLYVFMSVRQRL